MTHDQIDTNMQADMEAFADVVREQAHSSIEALHAAVTAQVTGFTAAITQDME